MAMIRDARLGTRAPSRDFTREAAWEGRAARVLIYTTRVSWYARVAAVLAIGFAAHLGACDALTSVVVTGADFGGATADAYCDRRYVSPGGQRSAFCQEVVNTVAASQFADDCRTKHLATAGPGLCPRSAVIAGCKLLEQNQDGSQVWDWYYDVSAVFAEAGVDETDGGDDSDDAGALFAPPVAQSVTDVASICADTSRYPDGAELTLP